MPRIFFFPLAFGLSLSSGVPATDASGANVTEMPFVLMGSLGIFMPTTKTTTMTTIA